MEPSKKPRESTSSPDPDSPAPEAPEAADADATASDEADLPRTVVDLPREANAGSKQDDASESDETDVSSTTASTDSAKPADADVPTTTDVGSTKGATLSKPPADVQETATSDVVAGETDDESSKDRPSAAASIDTKGATLSEPPASARDEAGADTTLSEERKEDASTPGPTCIEDETAAPVDEAKPVIDLGPAEEEPVAEAEPVLGTAKPAPAEPSPDVEPVAEAEPAASTTPSTSADEPTPAAEDEAAEPVVPTETTASTATSTASTTGAAAVAGALGADRVSEEEAETAEDVAPRVETFDDSRSEPEPASVTTPGPAVAAPSAFSAAEAPRADTGKRVIAYVIDAILASVLGLIPSIGSLLGAVYFLIRDGLDVDFMKRRSLGKKLMKLRPIRLDGGEMDLEASLKRNWMFGLGALAFIPYFGWFLYLIILVPALFIGLYEIYKVFTDPEGRRWGDDLANTKVIEVDE